MACMDEKDTDVEHGEKPFRTAKVQELREDGRVSFVFMSTACLHCKDGICVRICPKNCLYKDEESGLTLYDNTNCIGCGLCADACPIDAISFNKKGKIEKCDGCISRLRAGLVPACVRVCPTGALEMFSR